MPCIRAYACISYGALASVCSRLWWRPCTQARVCASRDEPEADTHGVGWLLRRQTAAYPPTDLPPATQYGTPIAILFTEFTKGGCDTPAWKMTVVIGIPGSFRGAAASIPSQTRSVNGAHVERYNDIAFNVFRYCPSGARP